MSSKRKGNGEGCIRKLNDGAWEARIMTGRKSDGKPKIKTFYGKTRKIVAQRLNDYIVNKKDKEPENISNQTLSVWLQRWFDDYVDKNVKISTKSSYETIIQRHLIPYIGNIKLNELKKADIENLYAVLLDKGRADGKGGLKVKTVKNVALVLHKALKDAMRYEFIEKNPADYAIVPSFRSCNTVQKKVEVLTKDEQTALLEVCGDDVYSVAIKTALCTGVRLGELLGLKWEDIDYGRSMIKICRQVNRLKDYSPNAKAKTRLGIQNDTKTKTSNREIFLPSRLMSILEEHKGRQNAEKLKWGQAYNDFGMIFARENGYYIDPSTCRDYYLKKLAEAGISHHTFHALRHTFATRALENGTPVKVVSEILGHSTVQITMDTYMHVQRELQIESMNSIIDYMGI